MTQTNDNIAKNINKIRKGKGFSQDYVASQLYQLFRNLVQSYNGKSRYSKRLVHFNELLRIRNRG